MILQHPLERNSFSTDGGHETKEDWEGIPLFFLHTKWMQNMTMNIYGILWSCLSHSGQRKCSNQTFSRTSKHQIEGMGGYIHLPKARASTHSAQLRGDFAASAGATIIMTPSIHFSFYEFTNFSQSWWLFGPSLHQIYQWCLWWWALISRLPHFQA